MNKTLEKIVVWATITAQVLFSGCATTTTSEKKHSGPAPIIHKYPISNSNIKVRSIEKRDQETIDGLIETSEDYIRYLEFRKNYIGYGEKIMDNIKNNEFKTADRLVQELATKLEQDENKYAQDYLRRVKNYNYFIIEGYNVKEETDNVVAYELGNTVVAFILLGTVFADLITDVPISAIKSTTPSFPITNYIAVPLVQPQTKINSYKHFNLIKVIPYTGRKETILERVPYEKLTQELEKYQNRGSE